MNTSNDRIQRLKELLTLEEQRAKVQTDLDALVARIDQMQRAMLEGKAPASTPVSAPKAAPVRVAPAQRKAVSGKAPRGALKESILQILKAAGSKGISVKEIAATLNTKPANIHAFFHSTGKRISSIKKLGGATYAIAGSEAAPAKAAAPAKVASKPAKPVKVKAAAAKAGKVQKDSRSRRGALSEGIIATLKSAGARGISLRDLSDKVGAKYKNLSIWFATTGKKNPSIRRVAPGTYAYKG